MIKLSRRLAAVAKCAADGHKIIDVGTDHGYIPVYLAQLGGERSVSASDIREGPLSSAVESAELYGVTDDIEFFLSDGLDSCGSDFDTVILAGMGGETIVNILSRAEWTNVRGVSLVLQPQSKLETLLKYLADCGHAIVDAKIVEERKKYYMVIKTVCDGVPIDFTEIIDTLVRQLIMGVDHKTLLDYLNDSYRKAKRALNGLRCSAGSDVERERELLKYIDSIDMIRQEVERNDYS